jgi:hypothetical protein
LPQIEATICLRVVEALVQVTGAERELGQQLDVA